jgi:hypothetical protein
VDRYCIPACPESLNSDAVAIKFADALRHGIGQAVSHNGIFGTRGSGQCRRVHEFEPGDAATALRATFALTDALLAAMPFPHGSIGRPPARRREILSAQDDAHDFARTALPSRDIVESMKAPKISVST